MRTIIFILLLLSTASLCRLARAQTPQNPTPDQLMQLMRSQPKVNISVPVTATAAFDPPVVGPGEKALYRVTFNATSISVNLPEKLPAPPELKVHLSCSGQTMQTVGSELQNFAAFNYDVRADVPGRFTMPEFTAEVYGQSVVVPAAQLEVKADLPAGHEPLRQLLVKPAATNVFVGEALDVSVMLTATAAGSVEGISSLQLNGDSFVVDKNAVRQSIRPVEESGRRASAYVYETTITPIAAGKISLSAQGFTAGMRFSGPVTISGQASIPGGLPGMILLDSEPVTLNVRPLPAERELPGFQGAIGSYACDPPVLKTNVLTAGEPVQLEVVIRGQKNLNRLNPPLPPQAKGWQVFPAERGSLVGGLNGPGASFKYTLIPLTPSLRSTPPIPFSCFDPARGDYVNLTIASLPVTVLPSRMQTNSEPSLMLSEDVTRPERRAGLGKLAASPGWTADGLVPLQMRRWFLLVQTLPAFGFCGLWYWDRRRRFLEAHPDVVRRREARGALRRERRLLAQAAARGDAETFTRRAIQALQIASAPHYPATPRALVCGDVLQILTATEREGRAGATVRRLFAAADAAAFANSSGKQTGLLAEKSSLDEILSGLEERL